MLRINQQFPNPSVLTTVGLFQLHKFFGTNWAILFRFVFFFNFLNVNILNFLFLIPFLFKFSHPANFTPVCTTELSKLAKMQPEFEKRETKIICLSVDSLEDHNKWKDDIEKYADCKVNFPLIADLQGEVSEELGMLDGGQKDKQSVRAVYIISPDKKVKAVIAYPMSSGRNMNEILRVLDSLQAHYKRPDIVTPEGWMPGQKVLVKPGEPVPDDSETPDLPSKKKYINFINC